MYSTVVCDVERWLLNLKPKHCSFDRFPTLAMLFLQAESHCSCVRSRQVHQSTMHRPDHHKISFEHWQVSRAGITALRS